MKLVGVDKHTYEVVNNKLIRDGAEVAVLYSPGFGAGWYTWNESREEGGEKMLFCPELAEMIVGQATDSELFAKAQSLFPNAYCGGAAELTICWLPIGTDFYIREYDGSESVVSQNPMRFKA